MKDYLQKQRGGPQQASIIALEPKSQRMLSGPSAPAESELEDWLTKNQSFHLVMPTEIKTSKFYG